MLNICSSLLVPGSSHMVWIRNNIVVHVYILYSCTIFTGWWPNRHPPSWSSNSSCWAPKTNHNPIHDQIWACKSLRNKGTADCVGFLNIYLLPPDENFCKPCYIHIFISKLCVSQVFGYQLKLKKETVVGASISFCYIHGNVFKRMMFKIPYSILQHFRWLSFQFELPLFPSLFELFHHSVSLPFSTIIITLCIYV